MSWLSEYRAKTKRYNEACRELKEKGEIDVSTLIRVMHIQTLLIFGILSYLMPLVSINSDLKWIFEYPELAFNFKLYMAAVGGFFILTLILETILNRQIDKKVYEYMKQKEAKNE